MIDSSNKTETVRCAIYTRKSTELGLQQEFSSLDAQREAAQAYIENRHTDGWRALPSSFDDGGFSGGNLERPALQQLLADIEQGKVDCVVVYKVDRLSRSLLDFARLMEVFQPHEVTFVAVSQDFNTATPMGRLMLHVLLSFAQFEREIISERTRDKLAAARRKGKWLGSRPILGYNADWESSRLVIDEKEAKRVRAIFALYEELGSLSATVHELRRRGWHNKRSKTRKGVSRGGAPFTKGTLHYLLTNVTYTGQVKYQGVIYPGEQSAIVDRDVFERAQARLAENRRGKTIAHPLRLQGILQGKLFCSMCHAPMRHTCTAKGARRYRYYVCAQSQDHGAARSVPAGQFENYVLQELKAHFTDSGATAADLVALLERIDYDGELGDLQVHLSRLPPSSENQLAGIQPALTIHRQIWFRRNKNSVKSASHDACRIPRVTRMLALAIRYGQLLQVGQVRNYQELSQLGNVSRARIAQIMNLCLLAPDVQEAILFLQTRVPNRDPVSERDLRPIAAEASWSRQRAMWVKLVQERGPFDDARSPSEE